MTQHLTIINQHLQFRKVSLRPPADAVYIHMAAEIDHSPMPFYFHSSRRKKRVIRQAKKMCAELMKWPGVLSAVVFKARLIPPGHRELMQPHPDRVPAARFDFAVLIEADATGTVRDIEASEIYRETKEMMTRAARQTHIIKATNIRCINPVDHHSRGVYLFNYFHADNLQQNLGIWEYTAGWFQQETGLDNSTLLLPADPMQSRYTVINHCRWNRLIDILPSLLFKKTFHSFVLDNFYVNNVVAMPVLYKIA